MGEPMGTGDFGINMKKRKKMDIIKIIRNRFNFININNNFKTV